MNKNETGAIQSVGKAFDIIETLRNRGTLRSSDLAAEIDQPVSTVHSYLSTLERRGYVIKENEEYKLSGRFAHLGDTVKYQRDIYRASEPILQDLSDQTGESVNLLIEEYGMGIYLESNTATSGFLNYSYVRRREHLHSTAAGKAILSKMPDGRVAEILEEHGLTSQTDNTITDEETFWEELEEVRRRGVSFNDEENTVGLRAVGAPIAIGEDEVGAISISAPISRLKGEAFREEYPSLVKEAARSIEVDLV